MFDFINSIFNIIGDNVNKLVNLCFGEKKETPKIPAAASDAAKTRDDAKPPAWTRKKK
ncbi:MAG: hypothetical protein AAB775_01885 [Patescibacteria group bacterium]